MGRGRRKRRKGRGATFSVELGQEEGKEEDDPIVRERGEGKESRRWAAGSGSRTSELLAFFFLHCYDPIQFIFSFFSSCNSFILQICQIPTKYIKLILKS